MFLIPKMKIVNVRVIPNLTIVVLKNNNQFDFLYTPSGIVTSSPEKKIVINNETLFENNYLETLQKNLNTFHTKNDKKIKFYKIVEVILDKHKQKNNKIDKKLIKNKNGTYSYFVLIDVQFQRGHFDEYKSPNIYGLKKHVQAHMSVMDFEYEPNKYIQGLMNEKRYPNFTIINNKDLIDKLEDLSISNEYSKKDDEKIKKNKVLDRIFSSEKLGKFKESF